MAAFGRQDETADMVIVGAQRGGTGPVAEWQILKWRLAIADLG